VCVCVCVCVCMCVCVKCVSKESYRAGCFHHFQILVLNRATDKRVCVLRKAVQEVSAMGQAVLSIKPTKHRYPSAAAHAASHVRAWGESGHSPCSRDCERTDPWLTCEARCARCVSRRPNGTGQLSESAQVSDCEQWRASAGTEFSGGGIVLRCGSVCRAESSRQEGELGHPWLASEWCCPTHSAKSQACPIIFHSGPHTCRAEHCRAQHTHTHTQHLSAQ
jgi:hypothetical protein